MLELISNVAPEDPGTIVLVTRLSKLIYRLSTDALLGMSLKHYSALVNLRDGALPQIKLAQTLHVDENMLVLLLNELEQEELIARRRDPTDRRRHIVEITGRGRRALERGEKGMETLEEEILGSLTPSERATLRRLLDRVLAAAPVAARS